MKPQYIFYATKQVLSNKKYLLGFLTLVLLFFSIFILLPVFLIPANSLSFQLSIFTLKDYLLLMFLSTLSSLLVVMQIFIYKQAKQKNLAKGLAGGSSAIIAAIFGTASCASCLAAVFGFLGVGTVLFLASYKNIIVAIAILLMLISVYYASLKVKGVCDGCEEENVRQKHNQDK